MSLKIALSLLALFATANAHASSGAEDLKGSYDVKMQIGHTTFDEELVISDIQAPAKGREHVFIGTYSVPGIFISPVHGGQLRRAFLCGSEEILSLRFSIIAKENGQAYPVSFEAFGNHCSMKGVAKLADGSKLGEFTMKQNSPDCATGG